MNRSNTLKALTITFILVLMACSQALADLPQFADLAEKAGPAVVNVFTETLPKPSRNVPQENPFAGTPFEEFFQQFNQFQQQQRATHSLGSGFLISSDGYILTNYHVVERADKVQVKLQKGQKTYKAKVIGTDPDTDLALIKIEAGSSLPYLSLGDSDKIRVGEWVVAIGNPFGLSNTVTAGIISAKGRVIGAGPYDDFLQTDASINPGNSGGPLLNLDGQVVGINAAIVASGKGIGFAIPSNIAKNVLAQLKEHGKVSRGMLGITIQSVDENTAKALGLKEAQGALVNQVNPGGPADKAGIQPGDVITELNGKPVEDSHDLTARIGAMPPGQTARVVLLRKGQSVNVNVTLTERDLKKFQQGEEDQSANPETALGMSLGSGGQNQVVVMGVDPGSKAADAGIRRGDVLAEVNQKPVGSPDEAAKVIAQEGKAKGAVILLLKRQGQSFFRSIPMQ